MRTAALLFYNTAKTNGNLFGQKQVKHLTAWSARLNTSLSNLPLFLTLVTLIFFRPWSKFVSQGAKYLRYVALMLCTILIIELTFKNSYVAKNSIDQMLNNPDSLQYGRYYVGLISLTSVIISVFPKLNMNDFETTQRKSIKIDKKMEVSSLLVSFLLLIVDVYFKGFSLLVSRIEYLPKSWSGNFFTNLFQYASFISILLLLLSNFHERQSLKIAKWLLLIAWQSYFLGITSRAAISIGLLYFLSKSLKGESVSIKGKLLGISQIIFVYLLVLQGRSADSFGLRHVFNAFKQDNFFSWDSLLMVRENAISSVSIIGVTHQSAEADFSNLLTAANPLPGRWTNWYVIAPSMRINSFIPYSGFGELSVFGVFNFVLMIGILLALMRIGIDVTVLDRRFFGGIPALIKIICSAFLFLMLQYNLRSCLRIFEMGVVLVLLSLVTRKQDVIGSFRPKRH